MHLSYMLQHVVLARESSSTSPSTPAKLTIIKRLFGSFRMLRYAVSVEVAFSRELVRTVVTEAGDVKLSLEMFTLMIAPAQVTIY